MANLIPRHPKQTLVAREEIRYWCNYSEFLRGVAQLASALGLGPRGPRFESERPDH